MTGSARSWRAAVAGVVAASAAGCGPEGTRSSGAESPAGSVPAEVRVKSSEKDPEGAKPERVALRDVDPPRDRLVAAADPVGGWPRRVEGSGPATPSDGAATALGVLSFLDGGYTSRSDHPAGYGNTIAKALRRLRNVQDAVGRFGDAADPRWIRGHALATLALLEAYGMTTSSIYRGPARMGLAVLLAQRRESGGWGYASEPGRDDAELTLFAAMACGSARLIAAAEQREARLPSIPIEVGVREGFSRWADGAGSSAAGSALLVESARLLLRIYGGALESDAVVIAGAERVAALAPTAGKGPVDEESAYVAQLALRVAWGQPWKRWEPTLVEIYGAWVDEEAASPVTAALDVERTAFRILASPGCRDCYREANRSR